MYISQIFIYPIKSCGGISVDSSNVDSFGLEFDRQYMLLDRSGRFLSQRGTKKYPGTPRMSLLKTALEEGILRVSAGDVHDLVIPHGEIDRNRCFSASLHDDRCEVFGVSTFADRWFSDFLGIECVLVTRAPDFKRQIDPQFTDLEEHVGFADGYPFLMVGQSSLGDLQQRCLEASCESVPEMDRFRPNLVLAGAEPYWEDLFAEIRIGSMCFRIAKPCARCVIVNVEQSKGCRDKMGPLAVLSGYRKLRPEIRGDNRVAFGQNLIHVQKSGLIEVGDPVAVDLWKTPDQYLQFAD